MLPEVPSLGRLLRFARINDVPRLGTVATAGFYFSPVFEWERPHHATFPSSTVKSYMSAIAKQIRDPDYCVVVVEDDYEPTEDEHTGAKVIRYEKSKNLKKGDKVIVGFASWRLKSGSSRRGRFTDTSDIYETVFEDSDDNDQDVDAVRRLDGECEIKERKYFNGFATLEMLVVHPAYRRRGHGSTLVNWGNKLADLDNASIGVVAASTAESCYARLGFNKVDYIELESEDKQKKVYVGFWVRHPQPTTITAQISRTCPTARQVRVVKVVQGFRIAPASAGCLDFNVIASEDVKYIEYHVKRAVTQ